MHDNTRVILLHLGQLKLKLYLPLYMEPGFAKPNKRVVISVELFFFYLKKWLKLVYIASVMYKVSKGTNRNVHFNLHHW